MELNLNYLKLFIAAAESNSLTEVAEKTGYDNSNVSSTISKFEQQLGIKLFTRNPLRLTDIGRDVYKTVIRGYRDIEFAEVIAKSKNDIEYGKISVGCPVNITKIFFLDRISKAVKEHPNLQITIDNETNYKKILKKIENNLIQFALLDFIPTDEDIKKFEINRIFNTEYILVANKKIKINNKEELNKYKYITSEEYKYSTKNLNECFNKENLKIERSLYCSDTPTKIEAAKLGIGLAYVIKDAVKEELKKEELYQVEVPFELPKACINLIYIKDRLTKVDKEFIKTYIKI